MALASAILGVNQWHTWKEREDSEVNKYLGNGAFFKVQDALLILCLSGKGGLG